MKPLDRFLQDWRIRKAHAWVREGDRLLDLGCFDRTLLERVGGRVSRAVGIDPLATPYRNGKIEIVKGSIPGEHPFAEGAFDSITMLAVLEHIVEKDALAAECSRLLSPKGRVIITVPRPTVDKILAVLTALKLIDGMSLEEHHGYDIEETPKIFARAGFRLLKRQGFQLGLNQLFVFEKMVGSPVVAAVGTGEGGASAYAVP